MKKWISILISTALVFTLVSCGSDSQSASTSTAAQQETTAGTTAGTTVAEMTSSASASSSVQPSKSPETAGPLFSGYRISRYDEKPSVPEYRVEPGLSNIVNRNQFICEEGEEQPFYTAFELTDSAIKMLERNAFVICSNGVSPHYFARYEKNRYNYVPNFVTTDAVVHTFHLMFDYILREVETDRLSAALLSLTERMENVSFEQYRKLKGTESENAALRNVAYFNVARSLLDPGYRVREEVKDLVAAELGLIKSAEGIAPSPIVNFGQNIEEITDFYLADYSQYRPRGHYTVKPELERYFKASMWYGLTTFRSNHEDEVRSAFLMSQALKNDSGFSDWKLIYDTINFFVGECDDITPLQLVSLSDQLFGEQADLSILSDAAQFRRCLEEVRKMEPPKINSVVIFREEEDRDAATKGFRFLGQRFTVDASIFQRLIDREVPERRLPTALDIPAALGSDEALRILKSDYEVEKYPAYSVQMENVKKYLGTLDDEVWTSNLYWSWINMLRPLLTNGDRAGYPLFMRNRAWIRKELNTFLGSWTELKRDTILYAKQPMAEMGCGALPEENPDDRGYVEPNPDLYLRLSDLIQQMKQGLAVSNMLTTEAEEGLDRLLDISHTLTDISKKELAGMALSDDDYEFIRFFGAKLEHLFTLAKKDEMEAAGYSEVNDYSQHHPDAVVADVATDPDGQALEEATGYAHPIVVAFPRDGEVVLGVGSVFSHFEFIVPLDQRMTDSDWHEKMQSGYRDLPTDPWKLDFMAKDMFDYR